MARSRKYGEDLTYAEEHRHALPEMYVRDGHRLSMADRDWTEFCYHCHAPLAIIEEYRTFTVDLKDKRTTVTENLASAANVPAWLLAWRVDRPDDVQAEINMLNVRLRELERLHPIVEFQARVLTPAKSPLVTYTPAQWWEHIRVVHRDHHDRCAVYARRREGVVNQAGLADAKQRSPLWTPSQSRLI